MSAQCSYVLINCQIQEEESVELSEMQDRQVFEVKGGTENVYGKVNILLQAYISQLRIESFSLLSDSLYVAQVSLWSVSSLRKLDELPFCPGYLILSLLFLKSSLELTYILFNILINI